MTPDNNHDINQILVVFDLDRTILLGDSFRLMLQTLYFRKPSLYSPIVFFTGILRKLRLVTMRYFKEISLSRFGGCTNEQIQLWGTSFYETHLRMKISRMGMSCIIAHKGLNHHLVLATGAPDVYLTALKADLGFDKVICTSLEFRSHIFTGKIDGNDCMGSEKQSRVLRYAAETNKNLKTAFFYSDHHSDISLLDSVGNPQVVNPSRQLRNVALRRKWRILEWNQ